MDTQFGSHLHDFSCKFARFVSFDLHNELCTFYTKTGILSFKNYLSSRGKHTNRKYSFYIINRVTFTRKTDIGRFRPIELGQMSFNLAYVKRLIKAACALFSPQASALFSDT